MLVDITLKITPRVADEAWKNTDKSLVGHLGTHFDVMDKEFPLEYTSRRGVVFDVSHVRGRDIDLCDIEAEKIEKDTFVAFYTGYLDEVGYGNKIYFAEHPQLSHELIDLMLERGVSVIGVDCAGIRRGKEHVPADQKCANVNAFVVENLCGLEKLLEWESFTVHTYPMNYEGITGIPCRVVAEV